MEQKERIELEKIKSDERVQIAALNMKCSNDENNND